MTFEIDYVEDLQTKKVYKNVRCDGCDEPMKPVFTKEDNVWNCLQPDDGLEIHLIGGYGMAIDPMNDPPEPIILLCRKCVPILCEQWPAIAKIVKAHISCSLGHECSKEQKFVWRPLSPCCDIYCPQCKVWAANNWDQKQIDKREKYQPYDIICSCQYKGPANWGWQIEDQLSHSGCG